MNLQLGRIMVVQVEYSSPHLLVQCNMILSILFFPVAYPTSFNFHHLDVDS